jgi:predicted porin
MNKKILAVAIASAVAVPMVAQAVEYKISGHVNRMIRYADNDNGSDVQHVDNGASATRFRIQGSEDIGNGMKAGVYIETGVASNSSSLINIKANDAAATDTAFNIRHSALFFSGNWGKVTMGHTSDAQDGTSFADLSNTWLVNEYSSAELAGGVNFGGTGTGTTISSAFSSFDGGRRDVVRYDSPALGPVTVAVSIANNSRWSIGAFSNTSLGGGELSANIGYTDLGGTSTTRDDQFSMSASYLFSQGTSITGGYGQADATASGAADPDSFYVKLGHQWGSHAVSVHYSETHDLSARNEDNTMWGLGWVYTMRKDIEVYAGYNNYDLDRAGAEDVDVFVVGSRVKF